MFTKLHRFLRSRDTIVLALFCTLGAGCSGNDGGAQGGASAAVSTGRVAFAIGAQPAVDIESFSVDIERVALRSTGGVIVELLNATARIDLASAAEFSRLLSNARVPVGTYTSAVIRLDFSTADCIITGAASPALIEDIDGNTVAGGSAVSVTFATPIVVSTTQHPLIELDVDLGASLAVERTHNVVVLEPAFVLATHPLSDLTLVASGTLTSVDVAKDTASVRLRGTDGSVLESISLGNAFDTTWQIDGFPLVGADGIAALGTMPFDTQINAKGSIDPATGEFEAQSVEAGDGAREGTTSSVEGIVVGRTGGIGSDALVEVFGRSTGARGLVLATGTTFLVRTSSSSTHVARQDEPRVRSVDDITLGQRIRAHGLLASTILDASDLRGVVVLERTQIIGHVVGTPTGTRVTLDVESVDGVLAEAIAWEDAGLSAVDPHHVDVELGTLAVPLAPDARVTVIGHFRSFGSAVVDFDAESIGEVASSPSLVFVRNRPQFGLTVTAAVDQAALTLVASGTALPEERTVLDLGWAGSVPLTFTPPLAWTDSAARGTFTLRDRSTLRVRTFIGFADFIAALEGELARGAVLIQIGARGQYSRPLNTIDSDSGSAVID